MFLPREKKILHLLYKNENKFTTSQIAAELKVSPRTIKADIKKINEILEKIPAVLRQSRGLAFGCIMMKPENSFCSQSCMR